MSELHVFSNQEFGKVRSLMIGDEPWFAGCDAAKALGYSIPRKAIRDHVDDEDKHLVKGGETPAFKGSDSEPLKQKCYDLGMNLASTLKVSNYGMYIINESGLYSLIFSSKLPAAKRFKRWVTSEVLPALRRTGQYTMPTADADEREVSEDEATRANGLPERVRTRDDYIRAASIIATCRNERLPYVLAYLKHGGIEAEVPMPLPDEKPKALPAPAKSGHRSYATPEEQVEIMDLLNAAHDLDYSDAHLGKMLGCAKNDVRRWRVGMFAPRADRIPYIRAKLEALIHKAE